MLIRNVTRLAAGALAMVSLAAAAHPVGSIYSSEPFRLRGVTVPASGVPSWPLVAGDDIATGGSGAVVILRDGSRVTLASHSRVTLETRDTRVRLRLRQGAMTFRLKSGAAVAGLDLPALPDAYGEGSVWIFRNAAWYRPLAGGVNAAAESNGAPPVQITPFNLGYLDALRSFEPASLAGKEGSTPPGTPPPEAPAETPPSSSGPLPSLSNAH